MSSPETVNVLMQVMAERERQDAKWGEQNHPDGTGGWIAMSGGQVVHDSVAAELTRDHAEIRKRICDLAANEGRLAWRFILLEEVYEALAEDDPAKLRAELVQVSAVAVGWIEAIDRREARRAAAGTEG